MVNKQETGRKAAEMLIDSPIKVKIGKDELDVHRPTLRTLVAVSAEINKMPELALKSGAEIQSVINYAQYCERIADIFALLIVGARKRIDFLHRIRLYRMRERILDKYTPKELESALGALFAEMEIADFFALTTSLTGINLTKPTVEVGKN